MIVYAIIVNLALIDVLVVVLLAKLFTLARESDISIGDRR